ncbi:MAG: HAMP domain-containing histidine kinase [Bryobacterales bacterium]|nr:HAMP domain-containing histidine kinase [Bryobacterales bacterium]
MGDFWRHRTFFVQCVLAGISVCLLGLELWTLRQMEAAQRPAVHGPLAAGSLSIERVFSFPEVTCGPKTTPAFTVSQTAGQTPRPGNVTLLAREQFQYGLGLTACVFCGLMLGVAFSYRTVLRETRLAQLKSSFVSNVSHEMKTPLATIQMFAETLEAGRVHDQRKLAEYYQVIHKESRRLGQMIEDVLDFARMENRTHRFQFAPADIGDLVEDAAAMFEQQVEMAGGRMEVTVQRPLPSLAVDSKALGQAVQNLLGNALKYSAAVKDIRVSVVPRNSGVAIEVSDRGIGIPEAEQGRIFDKFYRVETGLAHDTKGAGLGLAMARHIVKAHAGGITVESRLGEGSRFTIFLPRRTSSWWSADGQRITEAAYRRG